MSLHVARGAGPVEPFAMPALAPVRESDHADAFAESRAAGHAAGEAAGYAEGLSRAAADLRAAAAEQAALDAQHRASISRYDTACARLAAAAAAFEAATEALRAADTVAVDDVEQAVVALSIELTETVLRRELSQPEATIQALHRSAALLPDRGTATIRVHPEVIAAVQAHLAEPGAPVRLIDGHLIGDPAIDRDGCVVEVGACRVDAQLATAIDRLRAARD